MRKTQEQFQGMLAQQSRMANSFVIDRSEQLKDKSEGQCTNDRPPTILSMINYKQNQPQQKIFRDAISNYSGRSRDERDFMEMINLSDAEFGQKYKSDPFFKMKVDLRIKKMPEHLKAKTVVFHNNNGEKPSHLTLARIKKVEERPQMVTLYEKYQRIINKK